MATDTTITFKSKTYYVPEGYTAEQYAEHLRVAIPEAGTAQLIKDSEGKYTLKAMYLEKG
ncbi:MAG TPA: hypothetical protein PLV96_07215 [Methanoregulaceae archaeon]|nr:hypothetical protein [Methanoregulaceae archaeon]